MGSRLHRGPIKEMRERSNQGLMKGTSAEPGIMSARSFSCANVKRQESDTQDIKSLAVACKDGSWLTSYGTSLEQRKNMMRISK